MRKEKRTEKVLSLCQKQWILLVIGLIILIYLLIFKFVPVFGWIIGFMEYKPGNGAGKGLQSAWVGLDNFRTLFQDQIFWKAIGNTLAISAIRILVSTIFPLSLAIIINEIRRTHYKKFVQTVSYLPHFVSWVVVASITSNILSIDGVINWILSAFGMEKPYLFMEEPNFFYALTGLTYVWKEMGWDAIIYIAAIAGIDQSLYEAAKVDGAGRIKCIFSITIPSILPTIVVLLVMNIGGILSTGYEQMYVLQTGATSGVAEVLDLYSYRVAFKGTFRYSLATCATIFKTLVGIGLVFLANKVANKFGQGVKI